MSAYPQSELAAPPAPLGHSSAYRLPRDLLRELRPKQWLKNGLLFFGLIYSLHLTDPTSVIRAGWAFVAFCCLSSAGYVFNDFRDLTADQMHPTKRHRPLASGQLSRPVAAAAAAALLAIGAALAFALGPGFAAASGAYVLVTATYSVWWKHIVLIDLFAISAGFVLRVVAGSIAAQVGVSPWLYVCTVLASLLIALGKRRSEVVSLADEAEAHRSTLEDYTTEFLDRLIAIVAAAALMAYSLYTFSAENVPRNHVMMITVPVVLYGLFRYLYLVQVRDLGGSPEELLLGDRSLAIAVVLFLGLSAGILYLYPPGS